MIRNILLILAIPLMLLTQFEGSQYTKDLDAVTKAFEPFSKKYLCKTCVAEQAPTENIATTVLSPEPEAPASQEKPEVQAEPEIIGLSVAGSGAEANLLEFSYSASQDGYVLLSANWHGGELYIPDCVEGKPVVEIGSYAFSGNQALTGGLYLPSTIKKIGAYAFSGCSNLSGALVLPSALEIIGDYAFEGVALSGDIVLPSSMRLVGEGAFKGAGFDGSLYLNDGLEQIGASAFANLTALCGDVFIPATVTSIGAGAFDNCAGLKGIYQITAQGYLVEYENSKI